MCIPLTTLRYFTVSVVRRKEQVAELKALGADEVILESEDVPARVMEITGGKVRANRAYPPSSNFVVESLLTRALSRARGAPPTALRLR